MKKILTLIACLCFFSGYAQFIKPNNFYGMIVNRLSADSALFFPTGCGAPTSLSSYNMHKFAFYGDSCNNVLYQWNPKDSSWGKVSGAVDSTAYSSLIQASDSLSVGIKDKKGRQSNIVILAPDGSSTGVSGSYTASNGDTLIGNDIQLGGSLSKFTTINTGAYPLSLNGNGDASSNVLKLFSTDGQPFWSISVNNLALYAKSTNGHAAEFDINPASTNTVVNTISLFRSSQGTAANGMGTSIDYMLQDASGFIQNSNQLITKWSDATHATLTSEFSITGVNNGSTNNILRIGGNGSAQFYGTVQLKNYTVATLPTGVQGMTAYVTDASSPSYLATVVGGGTVITPVFYNGANWVCH
jgi:hypothetical protein